MSAENKVKILQDRRKKRVRSKLKSVNRRGLNRIYLHITNKNLSAQVIDDANGKTLVSVTTVAKGQTKNQSNISEAEKLAEALVSKMNEKGIVSGDGYAFDRGSKRYHGKVKVFAEKLREKGIKV